LLVLDAVALSDISVAGEDDAEMGSIAFDRANEKEAGLGVSDEALPVGVVEGEGAAGQVAVEPRGSFRRGGEAQKAERTDE